MTEGANRTKFCAEPPPYTASGLKTELDAALEAKAKSDQAKLEAEGKITGKDKFETTVTVIAERTAPLDTNRDFNDGKGPVPYIENHDHSCWKVKSQEVCSSIVKGD